MCYENARIDAEKHMKCTSIQSEKIVYDCIDYPTFKKDRENSPYIDENDHIKLISDENPVDHRKYYPYSPQG